jgi:DNA primase
VMDLENYEFKEALQILWNYSWIQIDSNFDNEKYKAKKNIYWLYKDAVNYYTDSLQKYPEVKKYIFDRWISEEISKKFYFWYADSWLELYNYLKNKWYDDEIIQSSNIFIDLKNRKDKFLARLIFPIQNNRWDFVAFTARSLWDEMPKYLNSPSSDLYDKSNILYWLFNAKTSISKKNFVIITEWQMDTIAMQSNWFFNTVAVSWSALTDGHLKLIKRLTKKIFLCFDGDSAWEKATKLALEKIQNKWFEVKIISLPKGKDPDDLLQNWIDFNDYIDNAITPIWYYIEKSNFNINSINDKKELLQQLLIITKTFQNNIEKDFYLKEISKLLDLSEKIVFDEFSKIHIKESNEWDIEKKQNIINSQDLAIWYCLLDDSNIDFLKERIIFKEWLKNDLKQILDNKTEFIKNLELNKKDNYRGISLKIEIDNCHSTKEHYKDELEKLIHWLNRTIYKSLAKTLKKDIDLWDKEAFIKYSKLIQKAKKYSIK